MPKCPGIPIIHIAYKMNHCILVWGYSNSLVCRYLNSLGPKNHTRKISIIHKDFELYQASMYSFLYKNVWIFPLYILLIMRINTFCSKGIYTKMSWYSHYTYCLQEESIHSGLRVLTDFRLEVSSQFGTENHKWKISYILKKKLNYTNFS